MRKCQVLAMVVVLSYATGCGSQSEWERVPLQGVATVNGQPFVGSISLRPQADVHGPTVSTPVADGQFAFDTGTGPVSGRHTALLMPKMVSRDQQNFPAEVEVPRQEPFRIEVAVTVATDNPREAPLATPAMPNPRNAK